MHGFWRKAAYHIDCQNNAFSKFQIPKTISFYFPNLPNYKFSNSLNSKPLNKRKIWPPNFQIFYFPKFLSFWFWISRYSKLWNNKKSEHLKLPNCEFPILINFVLSNKKVDCGHSSSDRNKNFDFHKKLSLGRKRIRWWFSERSRYSNETWYKSFMFRTW